MAPVLRSSTRRSKASASSTRSKTPTRRTRKKVKPPPFTATVPSSTTDARASHTGLGASKPPALTAAPSSTTDTATSLTDNPIPLSPLSRAREARKETLWNAVKPVLVILLAGLAARLSLAVENDPTRGARVLGNSSQRPDPQQIVDTGFVITRPLYVLLQSYPAVNDTAALLNTVLVVICQLYVAHCTLYLGEFGLVFRVAFAACLRAFCGWFTYLPASSEYLQSDFDFPDALSSGAVWALLSRGVWPEHTAHAVAGGARQVIPFVSFFSGHVANTVMVANFAWHGGQTSWAVAVHVANALQIARLLGTRGHYTIDIIVGWIVATHVSNPAGRLGAYFSRSSRMDTLRDVKARMADLSATNAFETLIYAEGTRQATRDFSGPLTHTPALRQAAEYGQQRAGHAMEMAHAVNAMGRRRAEDALSLGVAKLRAYQESARAKVLDRVERDLARLRNTCDAHGIRIPELLARSEEEREEERHRGE